MKKVFGFILIGLGVISFFRLVASGGLRSGAEAIGAVIGVSLICFLPAYFLLRKKKQFVEGDNNHKNPKQ